MSSSSHQDKYSIDYTRRSIANKDVFVFVNHKTAIFCWAKFKENFGIFDAITFDSHGDFGGGFLWNADGRNLGNSALGSKYVSHCAHFGTSSEFIGWNLLDSTQNKQIVEIERKYLTMNNDNYIDVAFMKNIVREVYHYFLHLEGNPTDGKCDDLVGGEHSFTSKPTSTFKKPINGYVLDIDLDFFTKTEDCEISLIQKEEIIEYSSFLNKLFQDVSCIGMTIALEPDCCGSKENCLEICGHLSKEWGYDLVPITRELLV